MQEAHDIATAIAGEVIMSLKDANSKAREAAKELYLAMVCFGKKHRVVLV